jgi:hypothetical protein
MAFTITVWYDQLILTQRLFQKILQGRDRCRCTGHLRTVRFQCNFTNGSYMRTVCRDCGALVNPPILAETYPRAGG